MKKIFLSTAILTFSVILFSSVGFSQTKSNTIQKNDEIIIRKNDDSKTKTTIVIDSNNITINGQPLADYKGDVKVIRRKLMNGNSENEFFSPGANFKFNGVNSNRAFLGVLTEQSDKGALIKAVTKGSSAEKAGLKEGDVITKVDDKKITSPEDLAEIVKTNKPGDEVKISYLRNGKKKEAKVILGKTNDMPMAFNFNADSLLMNGRNFNFRMPPLGGLNNLPRSYFDFSNRNQPKLGLRIQETEDKNGVKILNVEEGSPADKAGLKKDDIIKEMNGEKVNSVQEIVSQIGRSENKTDLKIKAKRNNSEMNFNLKVPRKLRSANL